MLIIANQQVLQYSYLCSTFINQHNLSQVIFLHYRIANQTISEELSHINATLKFSYGNIYYFTEFLSWQNM